MDDPQAMEIEPAKPSPSPTTDAQKPKTAQSLMWIEKYRPQKLSDLLSHQQIITTLNTLISNNRLPHLLFCGPPGTGKTSTILACAKQMYGPTYKSMILELNASDDRGISVIRDQIKSFASTRRMFSSGVKLVVLDEADSMTSAAQMALRRVVEKFAANTRFCIICNYVNKIIPALQSRCTKFRFGPIPRDHVRKRVRQIAQGESVPLTEDGLEALLELGKGDMRRILNVLQSSHMAAMATGGKVDGDAVYANTGAPHPGDIAHIWKLLIDSDYTTCSAKLQHMKALKGLALQDIITELLPYVVKSDLKGDAKMYIYERLAELEVRLAVGGSDKLNLAALVGCCKLGQAISMDKMVC
ncbi:Replication factor C subunit 5 [Gracilariopsis chorda]|uniref:Replication factor C subunit 5 n=1 Tax=Gracilariopsis chorda TaxID=448386 RepID=A0A2V3IDG4_9FLOR|nr:Replication factor C subunit 5 [Gracilariopsis chorda]|eukprot:PXF40091.1 Replication factor C subunit 5 [Gracilariopsis chorda]